MDLSTAKTRPAPPELKRLLLVEDDRADAYILCRLLESDTLLTVEHVEDLAGGLERLGETAYDCVLLDLALPDSLGLDTFRQVHRQFPDVPVVVLSGDDDEQLAVHTVRDGAQDYLVKGRFDAGLLVRAIRYAVERHHTKELLRSLSLEDDLTGLYNRRGFRTLAEQQLKLARRQKHPQLLLFADLDGLKQINDTLGHDAGNRALVEVARLLESVFRESDILARVGGDEFAALLDAEDGAAGHHLAHRLNTRLVELNRAPGRSYPLSLSLGVAVCDPEHPLSLDELIRQADRAMYDEKHRKKPPGSAPSDSAG